MDALQRAQQSIERAESYYDTAEEKDGNAFYRGRGDTAMANAAIFAAVAQAEAAQRQAAALERIADALYAHPLPGGKTNGIASIIENVGLGAY